MPTLLVGGSLSRLAPLLQITFDALTPGPAVMAYVNLSDALHVVEGEDVVHSWRVVARGCVQ